MASGRLTLSGSTILGMVLLSAGCATIDGKPLWPLRIPPSRGDGDFRDISWRFPWPSLPVGLPVPGYVVRFPTFDLGEDYQREFAVADLHDIKQKVGVYLFVSVPWHPHFDDDKRQLQAEFEFEVRDAKGQIVAHAKNPLSKLIWSTPLGIEGCEDGYALYSLEESFFQVHKGERYTLRAVYRPDPTLRAHQGFVYLQCGGSI